MRNHRKIKALRNKFGATTGYALWGMILEYLTGIDGNVFEFSSTEIELMAGDFGVSSADLTEFIEYCIKLELLFVNQGFVSSQSLDEYLAPVYEKRQVSKKISSKQARNNGQYCNNNTEPDGISVTEMPQIKLNKTKREIANAIRGSGFEKFINWISVNANKVGKMSEPFTESEYTNLVADYEPSFIKSLLTEMHNYKDLVKKNTNANLTFRNWARRRDIVPFSEMQQQAEKRGVVI